MVSARQGWQRPTWVGISLGLGCSLVVGCSGQSSQTRNQLNGQGGSTAIQANNASRTQANSASAANTTISANLKPGVLVGGPSGARVNLREQPSLTARIIDQGIIGEQLGVEQGQRNSDGSLWYRVKLYATGSVGWIYGSLVQLGGSTQTSSSQTSSSQAASTNIPLGVALEKCRVQTRRELGKDVTPAIALDAPRPEGGYQLTWSTTTGASGTCTVDRNARVIGFVSNAAPNSTPAIVLDRCRDRIGEEFPGLVRGDMDLYSSQNNGDGTFLVNWRTKGRAAGTCVADKQGKVQAFNVQQVGTIPDLALNNCQNRAVSELKTYRSDVVVVNSSPADNNRYNVLLKSQNTNQTAVCLVDSKGAIASFTLQSPTSTPTPTATATSEKLQDFSTLPGIGRFQVVLGSGRDVGNLREFTALVDNQRQTWWANCKTSELGKGRDPVPGTDVTAKVSSFVCTDQPRS